MASQTATALKSAKGENKTRMPRKKLDHLSVKKADNVGHIITDHFVRESKNGEYHPPEEKENVFTHGPTAVQHLMKHMGVKDSEMITHLGGGAKEEKEAPAKKEAPKGKKEPKAEEAEAEEPEEDEEEEA
jgi:hypothetical protein